MRKLSDSPGKVIAGVLIVMLFAGCMYLGPSAWRASGRADKEKQQDYIKWVEFNVTYEALDRAFRYDVDSYGRTPHYNWVELLACLGAKYGGDFSRYKDSDLDQLIQALSQEGASMETLTKDMEYYTYYYEAYEAVLGKMVGKYKVAEKDEKAPEKTVWKEQYGLKAYHPIAKSFPYGDYDDFGVSRSYGYRRNHLGHDMMGQVGTPVVAVESGYVRELGWNQYGGWRIGISSFDDTRYYYYAHLRQNYPYSKSLRQGSIVQAGDVIGYMGRTGYSTKENVNNIDTYHLHFGLQLIFDESQREGNNEIWVDCYQLVRFLYQNQSEVARNDATKEWSRTTRIKDPEVQKYKKSKMHKN